jgi:hypothetical protein
MNRNDFDRRLKTIPEDTRRNLEAMYREHFRKRQDGGLDYNLDDHLWQTYAASMKSMPDNGHGSLADTLGLPGSYFSALRSALDLATDSTH